MQPTYNREMEKGIAGTLFDLSGRRIDSYVVETGTIHPGMGVVAGTDPEKQVKLPSSSVSSIKGIVLLQGKEQNADGAVVFEAKDSVSVLDKGRAFVEVDRAVTADQAAYLIYTGSNAGKWTNSTGAAAVAGARSYTITTNFVADDTITIGGVTFTAKASGATGAQFNVGADAATSAANLQTVLAANTTVNATYTATVSGAVITLTETTAGGGNTPAAATTTGTGVVSSGTATTSEAADASAITGAKFKMTTTAAGVAVVELN